ELRDQHTHLVPVLHVDIHERIQDAYLDQYLWYEAMKTKVLPKWVENGDKAQLKAEKEKMLECARKMNEIKEQESSLNEEERVITKANHIDTEPDMDVEPDTDVEMVDIPLLDPFVSPLEMFSSYRFILNGDPFNIKYNGMFIPNLTQRSLCSSEISGAVCTDPKCLMVHFKEFEMDNQTILKLMCCRDFDNVEYKEFLINELDKIKIDSPALTVNQLAGIIARLRQEFFGGFLKESPPSAQKPDPYPQA
ncbi:hypothetical protein FF38_02809, partial [Lucilia cuprina]